MFKDLEFNIFALSLILSGGFAFILAAWIMRKRRQTFNWFSLMLAAAAWWAVAYGFELASTRLDQMMAWIKVEYLGIVSLPSLWLIFCYSFIGRDNRLNNLTFLSLLGYSSITYIVVLTNAGHHLFYESTNIDYSGPFALLNIVPGPYYHLHTVVFYSLVLAGYWALIAHLRHTKPVFRAQNRLLIIGTLIPLTVNIGYIFLDIRPYGHLDLTPFAFLLTSFIIAIGLMRFGLFDISPMARSKVIQNLKDGVAVLDIRARLIDFNPAFEQIVQQDGELFGFKIQELLPLGKVEDPFPELDEKGILDYLVRLKDGRVFEVSTNGLFEKTGIFKGHAVLFKDVTARVENQRALELQTKELMKLNDLKDRLFSVIAHDLRGPLLSLKETMKLVNSNAINEAERNELLKLLTTEVDQSVGLMQNLLDWAQSQQKGEKLELSLFEAQDLIKEAVEPLQASIDKKQQHLLKEIETGISLYADRERLKIVLRNLINNAIKFTPEKGNIKVILKSKGEEAWFAVEDNGLGLTEKQLQKLKSAGELESTFGTSNEKGSGLGLMLVRDYLKQHASSLEIKSQLGFGSTFSFGLVLIPEDTHPSDPDLYKYQ
ncbi:MAG: ATP-binding protein [Bacteroidetes bacterium]|nr:ATP-binding protein [Bacteroidota bacterium]